MGKQYALKDSQGEIYEKTPEDMQRLASEIARIEKKYKNPLSEQELFDLFDRFRYIIPKGAHDRYRERLPGGVAV